MGIFGKLFGGKKNGPELQPSGPPPAEEMTLAQVLIHLQGLDQPKFGDVRQSYRRLIDIGLFEHGYTDEDREIAVKMADAVKTDIIKACEDRPGAVEAFHEASEYHIGQAKYYGYGSLHWITEETGIGADKLVEFVVQPQFAKLLPDYLAMQSDETLQQIRFEFVKAIIASRREHSDQTDLQVLFELVSNADPAIGILMSEPEIAVIRDAPNDYAAAELLTIIYQ